MAETHTAAPVDDEPVETAAADTEPERDAELDESADLPSFQQAFERAKATHSSEAAPRRASPGRATTAAPPPAPTKGTAAPAPAATAPTESALLSDTDLEALQTEYADDPKGFASELTRRLTEKVQALPDADRSRLARLTEYEPVIDELETDAEGTLARLAREYGYELQPATAAGETRAPAPAAEAPKLADQILSEVKASFGDDLDYLADPVAKAITSIVEKLLPPTIATATEPIRSSQEALLDRVATEQTDAVMSAFEKAHPDYKTHEDAMMALSERMPPGKGMTEGEYLESLYTLVTHQSTVAATEADVERRVAERVKKALGKITTTAATTEAPSAPVAESHIARRTAQPPTFREAYEAAKRGERLE
jgi:hypothetical protein